MTKALHLILIGLPLMAQTAVPAKTTHKVAHPQLGQLKFAPSKAMEINRPVPVAMVNVSELKPSQFQPGTASFGPKLIETAPAGRTLYRWSVASVLAVNAADAASSWRQQEANPFVAGSGTQFGGTSIAIKSGFVATSLILQHVALRHRPDLYKRLAWINFATTGAFGGVVAHNMSIR